MANIREIQGKTGTSYKITVSNGYDITGKKIIETATFRPDPSLTPKKREKAIQDFACNFEEQVLSGACMDGRKITLKAFSDKWIEEYAKQNLQPGTITKYKEELNDKILPVLGHLKLSELKPHNLNSFFVSLTKDGIRKDGKPGGYSKGSIAKTRNVLSSILRTAVDWELLDKNPCDRVKRLGEDTAERLKYFTPEQVNEFLSFIKDEYTVTIPAHERIDDTGKKYKVGEYHTTKKVPEQLQVLFNVAVYTGMRKGEILALQWPDIDFERDIIKVSKAVTIVDGKPVIKPPKTKSGYRTIAIPHVLTEQIKELRRNQIKLRSFMADSWKGDNWVFIQSDGKQMSYSTPYEAMQDIIKRYNDGKQESEQLPFIPFHGLRHTSATLLIAAHEDTKTVSHRLGHAQTSTTLNIYAHALEESDKEAATALEKVIAAQAEIKENKSEKIKKLACSS